MIKKIILLSVTGLVLTGCTQKTPKDLETAPSATPTEQISPTATNSADQPSSSITPEKNTVIPLTMRELVKHNDKTDCWLLIEDKVYDVTAYVDTHPGGESILAGCGKDATSLFATKGNKGEPHSKKATETLSAYYLGKLIAQ